jgi:hypothetical protein
MIVTSFFKKKRQLFRRKFLKIVLPKIFLNCFAEIILKLFRRKYFKIVSPKIFKNCFAEIGESRRFLYHNIDPQVETESRFRKNDLALRVFLENESIFLSEKF